MSVEIPEFLKVMSERMNNQDGRCTAHPFFQVRCKRYLVTAEGYSDHHFEIVCDDGTLFRSDTDDFNDFVEGEEYAEYWKHVSIVEGVDSIFHSVDDVNGYLFCEFLEEHDLNLVYVQEVEDIVSTHMTEAGANEFIARKQHDYPKLYTHAESAYWSSELKQLQYWIKSLIDEGEG